MVCIVGLFITYLLVRVFSWKAIQPAIKNAERQKKFITNASHEVKTPLAVIKANTEFIEMTDKESEWTKSTLEQVDRMDGLIRNLVMISRDSEKETDIEAECDISSIAADTAGSFESLGKQRNIRFSKIFFSSRVSIASASPKHGIFSTVCPGLIFSSISSCVRELCAVPSVDSNKIFDAPVSQANFMAGSVPMNCTSGNDLRKYSIVLVVAVLHATIISFACFFSKNSVAAQTICFNSDSFFVPNGQFLESP